MALCDCGFWPSLLGDPHEEGACNLLIDKEVEALRTFRPNVPAGAPEYERYPGMPAFDEWIEAHKGPDGILVFTDEELEPYRGDE